MNDEWIGSFPVYTEEKGPESGSIVDFYDFRIKEKDEVEIRIQGIEMLDSRNLCYTKILTLDEVKNPHIRESIQEYINKEKT